jgi:hypothetical protein
MTAKNPFPGMNPFFERQWRDAHSSLITYLRDALQERLPPDLLARAEEEESATIGAGQPRVSYRPDVQVREPYELREPGGAEVAAGPPPAVATKPVRVFVDPDVERWLEIREQTGRLVTVIELLSPSNKLESADRDRHLRKRRAFIGARANLVEIDLVRQGAWVFPQPVGNVLRQAGAGYGVCVVRAERPGEHEVYPLPLRQRLPSISIPLRPTDGDVVQDLQPLIDQCHERGRYHLLDYRLALEPQLAPDDAAWADQLLRRYDLL